MVEFELKMVVTKKFIVPDDATTEPSEVLQQVLNDLTIRAKDDKIEVVGDFMFLGIEDQDRDLKKEDIDKVYFLGVLKNG